MPADQITAHSRTLLKPRNNSMKELCTMTNLGIGLVAALAITLHSPAQTSTTGLQPTATEEKEIQQQSMAPGHAEQKYDFQRNIAPYFAHATDAPKRPDADGFVQRWLLLEPIVKANRTNAIFTGTYVRKTFHEEYFPGQFTVLPHDGDAVTVEGRQLFWHALDAKDFNIKLFRFAYGLNKPTYGVIFWMTTVIESPQEIADVRMAVGSNSASMWWLNGEEAADLFDDRRMVMDDVVSKPLTLKKGRNVVRGAIINGPGLSDFCLRFIDENGKPVRNFSIPAL
jgi:hypothetical protein